MGSWLCRQGVEQQKKWCLSLVNEESCLQESWEGGTGGWVLLLGSAGMQASLCPRGNRMARGHTVCWGRGAALDDSSGFCHWKKPSGKERASPYPYCVFLRLSQLTEIRGNPSLPIGCECQSFYPKPLRASTLCAGKYSISILYQYAFDSCRLCWGGVSLRAGCRAHKLRYSSNPFALACPILHAAGNVGQAGFWDYLVLCKASSLCAFRKSLLLQQAGDWDDFSGRMLSHVCSIIPRAMGAHVCALPSSACPIRSFCDGRWTTWSLSSLTEITFHSPIHSYMGM